MTPIDLSFESIVQWCTRQKLSYFVAEPTRMVVIPRAPGQAPIRVIERADRGMMSFILAADAPVPEDRRAEVARALTLLNASSFMGAWVLNQSNGELYFRVTLPIRGTTWSDDAVMYVVRLLVGTFDGAGPAVAAVARGERSWESVLTPAQAAG